jgi:hypothetical protein
MMLNIFCPAAGLVQQETAMVEFAGTFATLALIVFVSAAVVASADLSPAGRLVTAALLGLWTGFAAAASAAGWMQITQPPVVGFFVVVPLIAAALFARHALVSLPLRLMIGLNIGRVFAVLFLMLEAQGQLSGPFPHSAAWGDIITGVVAIPMLALAREPGRNATLLHAWNLFGLADLIAAIALGVTSADGSLLQVFPAPGSMAMQRLPWSFVPTVLVPLWMMLHGAIFVQLLRATRPSPSSRAPG